MPVADDRAKIADRWEHFEHQADIGVRGIGGSEAAAFEQAALAMTAVVTDPALVVVTARVAIHCQSPDHEVLLVDWLNAVLFEMATRRMLFSHFDVRIDGDMLEGAAWGEALDTARHQPAVEVKGATFTELKVAQCPDGSWLAQCVVDV